METLNSGPSNPEPESTPTEPDGLNSLEEFLNQKVSRRKFNIGALTFLGALALSSCNKRLLDAAELPDPFEENSRELSNAINDRKEEFLNDDWTFNYERFIQTYPGFEHYWEHIEDAARDASRTYGVNSNAIRALTCSIVASNMNSQDPIDPSSDKFNQRVGVMQFVPINLLRTSSIKNDPEFPSTVEELSKPEKNIKFGVRYLVEGLKQFRNDGENKDIMQLVLAQYYGEDSLVEQIKYNREIKEGSSLWSNYTKYINTLKVLGVPLEIPEETKTPEVHEDLSMEQLWKRVEDRWSESRFKQNKDVFFQQAMSYAQEEVNIERLKVSKEEFLALFAAIARAESKGGIELYHPTSQASGWFQLVPTAKHLRDYNHLHNTSYQYENFRDEKLVDRYDPASISVGVWALMRYRHSIDGLRDLVYQNDQDMHVLMKFFKAGGLFGQNIDDALWWNRVCYGVKSLLGRNAFNMEYLDYKAPRYIRDENGNIIDVVWEGPFKASKFEELGHIGVMAPDSKKEA